jgi:pimeloyl-ACP methyl ester carboxylesterase
MQIANESAVKIFFEIRGRGELTFLLMHGWCDNSRVFSEILPRLTPWARVITLDWPGHGQSPLPAGNFGYAEMIAAATEVIAKTGSDSVIPVAISHAGWVALELARRLPDRIHKLVLLDWIVLDPPPPFLGALEALQDVRTSADVRDGLFSMWKGTVPVHAVERHIEEQMRPISQAMWSRAGREISQAYSQHGNPLQALDRLDRPVPTLHLYSQPKDPAYFAAQQSFAKVHPWFQVQRLDGGTHFPCLEEPDASVRAIQNFVSA